MKREGEVEMLNGKSLTTGGNISVAGCFLVSHHAVMRSSDCNSQSQSQTVNMHI